MKTPIHNGDRKKLSLFSFAGARARSNSNPNTPGPDPQNSEILAPVSVGADAGVSGVVRGSETDDEWYIPYKGPYELPSTPSSSSHYQGHRAQSASSSNVLPRRYRGTPMASSLRRSRSRDSWGDPIYPAHDSEGSGYAHEDTRAMAPGAELDRGRNRIGRDRDNDNNRGRKEAGHQNGNRPRRSGSLTVTISKSRMPGFNTGGHAVNSEVKGIGRGTGMYGEKEIEDEDPSHRHRHRHRPVLISTYPTGPIGSSQQPSHPIDTNNGYSAHTRTHRRRPSSAPSSPTRFQFSQGPDDSVSRSRSPSPPPAASSPKRSRPRAETATALLLPGRGRGLGLDSIGHIRSRSTASSGSAGIFARPHSSNSSAFASASSSHSHSVQTQNKTEPAKVTYIDLDSGSMGGVGKSPVPAFGGSRSRPPMDGKGIELSNLFVPAQKLFKKFKKKSGSAKEEGKKDEGEREEREGEGDKERERDKERGKEKEAATGLRSHESNSRPQPRSHSRPALRIHPPGSGGGIKKQDRAYRQGRRTEALATESPLGAEQYLSNGDHRLNSNIHSRNRSSSLPQPPSQVSPQCHQCQAHPERHQPHARTRPRDQNAHRHPSHSPELEPERPHQHTRLRDINAHRHPSHSPELEPERSHPHTRVRDLNAHRHPSHSPELEPERQHPPTRVRDLNVRHHPYHSPEFGPEQQLHSHGRMHRRNPHSHPLNSNISHSDSHSLTSTAIATQPSVGTHSKLSPSSSGGGGAYNRLEMDEMERQYAEEEEEGGYAYEYGFVGARGGGGGGATYGGPQPLSAASSWDESHDPMVQRAKKYRYAYEHGWGGGSAEDVPRHRGSPQQPYARTYSPTVFSQRSSTTTAGDGNDSLGSGAGSKWSVRRAQVVRLSPIPSGPSVPSMSVPSVGAAGGAASVGGGGGAAGGSDNGNGMGDMSMFGNTMSTPDLRFANVDGHGHEQKQHVDEDGGSGRASASTRVRDWSRLGAAAAFKERERIEKEKEMEKERKLLSAQTPQVFLLPRPRFRVETLERGETPTLVGGSGPWQGSQEAKGGKQGLRSMSPSRTLLNLVENAPKAGGGGPSEMGVKPQQGDGRNSARDNMSLRSLERVLEERERLEKDRKAWQARAIKSIGNKQSRAVSRSRSKSLTQAGRLRNAKGNLTRRYQQQQSNIDYLAARACVGDQNFSPLREYNEDGPWLARRPKEKTANKLNRHDRMPSASGSSVAATTSVAASSEGHHSPPVKGHERDDSWSRSAIRLARSLPQMCGITKDSAEEQLKSGKLLEEALNREDTKVIRLADPAAASLSGSGDQRVAGGSRSPAPSGITDGGVGIALSTPPISDSQGPSFVLSDHPYTFGAEDGRVRADVTGKGRDADLPIRMPAHPYAQTGLPTGGNPDYAGRHPTSHPSHLLGSLGLSEVSARHRLPPQLIVGQHPSDDQPSREQGGQPLYVRVNSWGSYQAVRPYVRADSDIAPDEKLWVTYSPGVVREVLASEVFQYSPREEGEGNLPASSASSSKEGGGRRDQPDDMFLSQYQRMSTVYQDTAAMGEALADAMYDSFNQRGSTAAEPRYSSTSGSAVDDGGKEVAHNREDSVESAAGSQPRQGFAYNVTDYQRHLRGRVPGPSSSSKSLGVPPDASQPFGTTLVTRLSTNPSSKEASAYSSPATPSAPRISSPNNLAPFQDLFYRPPYGSESDSHSSHQVEPCDDEAPESVPWDVGSINSQRTGLTSLVRQIGDEMEQMALERQGFSGRYSQDSNIPDIPPRTSSLGRLGAQSGHINSEVGPLHFLFNSHQQEVGRPHNMARPGRFGAFDRANTIPEDIEVSENPSSDEKAEDDDTARYPVVTIDPALTPVSSQFNYRSQLPYRREANQSEEHLPAEPLGSSRRPSLDALRSGHLTTSSLSHVSSESLSEFPEPPETITSEQMSVLSSYLDDNTTT